jgi:hypothetical protein
MNRKTEERFYRILDEAQRDKGSLTTIARGEGRESPRFAALKDDPAVMLRARLADPLMGMAKQLAEIRKTQVYLTHRSTLSAEKKTEAMRILAEKRDLLFSRFRDLEDRTERFTKAPTR